MESVIDRYNDEINHCHSLLIKLNVYYRVRWILYQVVGSVGRLILIVGWWLRVCGRRISLWKLHVRTRRWIRRLCMITSRLTRSCSTSCIAHPTTHWADSTESRRAGSRLHYTRTSAVHFVAMHVWRRTQWLLVCS